MQTRPTLVLTHWAGDALLVTHADAPLITQLWAQGRGAEGALQSNHRRQPTERRACLTSQC
jgi:hypothetical protein